LFLNKAERDFSVSAGSGLQITDGYSRVIKSRLQKKIERFITEELPLLIDKGFIQSKTLAASDVTGFSSVTENCNTEEKKTSKNGIKDAQISDIFAASNFYASWSGGE
jgi:hypothetical protein